MDPTNAIVILSVIFIAFVLLLGGLYIFCFLQSLQGQFDLEVDAETRQPYNKAKVVNPFRKQQQQPAQQQQPYPAVGGSVGSLRQQQQQRHNDSLRR